MNAFSLMAERKVFTEFREIIDPSHTALVIWDVQNMLVGRIFNREQYLPNITRFIDAAHSARVPVFFTKITPLPEAFESGVRLSQRRFPGGLSPEMLDLAVKPGKDDIVINKNTASIFIGTNFELMVRNAGIQTIVFAGIATEIGVESSARDSQNRGFYTIAVDDLSSSADRESHERSLTNMKNILMVKSSSDIMNIWSS